MSSFLIGCPIQSALCHIEAKSFVNYYLWAGNKSNAKSWVDFAAIILVNTTIIIIMAFDSTGACS